MNRGFFALFLPFYFFPTVYLCAGNLSGNFALSYTENKSTTQENSTKKDSFVQKYGIGYRGSVYSPKLLSFDLRTSLYLEESEIEANGQKSDSNSRGENYNVNMNFIKETFMPFSINKAKNYTPYWSVVNGESSFADQETDSTSVTGALKSRFFDIGYTFLESKTTKEDDISTSKIDRNDYSLTLYKAFDDKTINIQHSYNESDYTLDSIRYTELYIQKNRTENSRVSFNWDIKESLKLNSYSSYRNDQTFGVKSSIGNIGMRWIPSKKYNANFNMNVNKIESPTNTSDSVMFTESSSYIITPEITLNQNLLFFNTVTDSQSYDIYSAGVGSSYRKSLSKTLTFDAGANYNKKVQLNEFKDANTSDDNIDYNTFSGNAGVTKRVDAIASKLSANAAFSDQSSSAGDDNTRASVNMNLYTFLDSDIKNNFSISYAKDAGYVLSGTSDKLTKREIAIRTISDSLNYSRRIGFKGRLMTGVGISQREGVSTSSDGSEIKTSNTYPYANISFNYRIWRTMIFNSNAKVSQDTTYDLINYSAYAAINYNYRKIQMSISTNYLKRDDSQTTTSEQTSLNMMLTRAF